ncbi:hypothetical protein ANCDUO_24377 [Ancylostoma duodenale]|uniref:Uncharacterized protein n=1 Tax=Ancylostoma duodenale TaxID=51022 RepID=A0A0C2C7F2_9BILA|nr:hypothetical protein ANCDUO_24377 [Ancylostoma duodenale]
MEGMTYNSLIAFTVCLGLFGYCAIQEEVNPDSKWAGIFRGLTREPLKWLGADKLETKPRPGLSAHQRYSMRSLEV